MTFYKNFGIVLVLRVSFNYINKMREILILLITLNQVVLGHGPHGTGGEYHSYDNSNHLLQYYSGDFTDTDNDGMTDVYELKYGYNPNDEGSFPDVDFISDNIEVDEGTPIGSHEFMDLAVITDSLGIRLKWTDVDPSSLYNRYSLTLMNGEQTLYYGGHSWDYAEIDFANFGLIGSEVLRGTFSEGDTSNGAFIKDHPSFEIDLSDYPIPLPDSNLGEDTDKIEFKFTGFTDEQKEQYVDFMRRLIPIINDVVGNPAESFVCEFIMNEESSNSWVTLDHGRVIELDSNWNPRLLVHEMIHMWDGKYAFCWSGENREYADDFSGFAEIAEGIAYKILHEFVMAYPNHSVSHDTINGGSWNNWSSDASTFDLYKHQRFTGGGTFWTGDVRAFNFRYSNSAMLVQAILVENPNFIKEMRNNLFEILNQDSTKILNRSEIVSLWANTVETINGIDTTEFLNAMPVFNGRKLDQGFYPIVRIVSPTEVDVFSSYAVDGLLWWSWITNENYDDFNIPTWVKSNRNQEDGYYYVDMNDMPYTLKVRNVFEETIQSHELRSSNVYQSDDKIIPDNLGEVRVSDNLNIAPAEFPQGLYVYNLSYTDIAPHTDEATEEFYFMGQKDVFQNEGEYVLIFGVDSKFAEKVVVKITSSNTSFELPLINGSAILKTSELPLNLETVLEIEVHSNDETFVYKRSLIHAGNQIGEYRQQFLVVDRDFDGVEDLYDNEVSESFINEKYQDYLANYPNHRGDTDDGDNTDEKEVFVASGVVRYIDLEGGFWGIETSEGGLDGSLPSEFKVDGMNVKLTYTIAEDMVSFHMWGTLIDIVNISIINDEDADTPDVDEDTPLPLNDWDSATDVGSGWSHLEWFGYFYKSAQSPKWVFHVNLGWLYVPGTSFDSVWMFSEKYGWIWTSRDLFPFIYVRFDGWTYFDFDSGVYFDFVRDEYIKF